MALKPSILQNPYNLRPSCYQFRDGRLCTRTFARKVRAGVVDELRVHFTPMATRYALPVDRNERANSYPVGSRREGVGYVLSSEDTADLVVDLDSMGYVMFRLCDRQAEWYGVALLKHRMRVNRQKVEEVLFAAAKWKWHLQRKNTGEREITDLVIMELVSVGEKIHWTKKMFEENERESMNMSGMVEFVAERKNLYGVQLTSKVGKPLYLRMFYFDATDFSIYDLFGHTTGWDPVMTEDTFVIGNGGEGDVPLQFSVSPEDKLELGYLKVFWSTAPLDLQGLEQKPVFDGQPRASKRLRGCTLLVPDEVEWGTTLLTLVQRAPPIRTDADEHWQ